MGTVEIHKEDELAAKYLVDIQRGESMIAAIIRAMQKENVKQTPTSKTLILHNIPRDCSVDDLRNLFEKHGPIRDIYIPRNLDAKSEYYGTVKGFALIKYLTNAGAKKAYESEFGRLYIGYRLISIEYANEDR